MWNIWIYSFFDVQCHKKEIQNKDKLYLKKEKCLGFYVGYYAWHAIQQGKK